MKNSKVQKIALNSMMIALTALATLVVQIPGLVANGYVNLGDTVLMFAGLFFGPLTGFVAGSFGSALADLILGYTVYAPISFVVKGLEGLIVALIFQKLKKRHLLLSTPLATVPAGIFMALGYFLSECVMYGFAGALASVLGNLTQGLVNALLAILLYGALHKKLYKAFSFENK